MDRLRFAIQKSGRLQENSISLIKQLGVRVGSNLNVLKLSSANFPIDFLFLRDDDIPGYVAQGVADVGIVGQNVITEKGMDVEVARELDFAHCRLCIAVPNASKAKGLKDLEGKRIATSYPNILKNYAKQNKLNLEISYISGSVEVAPAIKLADGIFDIVSTGSTLMQNGLKEIETIMRSQAVLISNPNLAEEKNKNLKEFLFRLDSVLDATGKKYIVLNAPKEILPKIKELLPGLKDPTVTTLSDENWCSIAAVVKESDFWPSLATLKELGAQDVLVMPIEKILA